MELPHDLIAEVPVSTAARPRPGRRARLLADGAMAALAALLVLAVVLTYVGAERTIYYWDDATYQDMTLAQVVELRELPLGSPRTLAGFAQGVWLSTANDYSDLYTLPLVPAVLTFGATRPVYIAAIALAYLLPLTVAIAAVAARLVTGPKRAVFWSAALLALTVPALWLPTLRGYPDAGAAALFMLAALLYMDDPALRRWWRIGAIGLCLALAALFRRHFVYDGVAFFVAAALLALGEATLRARDDWRAALRSGLGSIARLGAAGAATLGWLVVLGWPFVDRVLHTSFRTLYASYEMPAGANLSYYQAYYGWIACALAGMGYLVGLASKVLRRRPAVFALLLGAVSLAQWVLAVKQLGVHYTLHFTPWLILGLVALLWTIWHCSRGAVRAMLLAACAVSLGANAAVGLTPAGKAWAHPLLAAPQPPLVRHDYAELVALLDYLRVVSSPEEPIFVAASSGVLNDDLLWHAERALYEPALSFSHAEFWDNRELNILHWTPFADSRDPYPLEALLQAQYVVVALPFQHHMRPEEQRVVSVVVEAFTESWPLAADFTRLPAQFVLGDNVRVAIYRRVRPTSLAVAVRTLEQMRDYIGRRPGGQQSWLQLGPAAGATVRQSREGSYRLDVMTSTGVPPHRFLAIDPLAGGAAVSGTLAPSTEGCGAQLLRVEAIDARGTALDSASVKFGAGETGDFALAARAPGAARLLLTIAPAGAPGAPACQVQLRELNVTPTTGE